MISRKQIALAFSIGIPHDERLVDGIVSYIRSHKLQWSLMSMPESPMCSINDLPEWPGDGVIANLNSPVECRLASTFSVPVVNISGVMDKSPVPRVHTDNRAIGEMAARHLLEHGFRRFAFYGLSNIAYSELRLAGFRDVLHSEGFECDTLLSPASFQMRNLDWRSLYERLETWMQSLRYPVGLFAVTDYRARILLEVCYNLKIAIPMKLAMVSVDNEETICEHNNPTLSSIDRNDYEIGWRAAQVLDDMMNGRPVTNREVLIKPKCVVSRNSTDTLSVEDDRLAEAIDFIRSNYGKPITVDWIARQINVSRRWLEHAFREHAQVSPYQYLCDYRITQAKRLIRSNKKLSILEVANLSGFDNPKHFNSVFKRVAGESPTQYRRGNPRVRVLD